MKNIIIIILFLLTFAIKINAQNSIYALTWDASPDTNIVVGYSVYQSIGAGSTNYTRVASVNSLMYNLTNIVQGNIYNWFVTSYSTNLESQPSGVISFNVPNVPPPLVAPNLFLIDPTQLVINNSFENGTNGWFASGNFDIVAWQPFQGTNSLRFNTGQTTPNAVVSQTIPTISGAKYSLTFLYGVLGVQQPQQLAVNVTGTTNLLNKVISATISVASQTQAQYFPQRFTFVADGNKATLSFVDVSTTSDSVDSFIDYIQVYRILKP